MENLKYAFIDIVLLVHREEFFLPFLPGELIICILQLPLSSTDCQKCHVTTDWIVFSCYSFAHTCMKNSALTFITLKQPDFTNNY